MKPIKYSRAIENLIHSLQRNGYEPYKASLVRHKDRIEHGARTEFTNTDLYYDLVEILGGAALRWHNRLIDTNYRPNWHAIEIDIENSPLEADTYVLSAIDEVEAWATVLQRIDDAGASLTHVENDSKDRVMLFDDDVLLAAISKIEFTEVSLSNKERCSNAMKGLMKTDSHERLIKGFSKIDGLSVFEPESARPEGYLNECINETANEYSSSLLRVLRTHIEKRVPRHLCQDLISEFLNFESWNHLKAFESERQKEILLPFIVCIESEGVADQVIGYYRGFPDGIHAFGQSLKKSEYEKCGGSFSFGCYIHTRKINASLEAESIYAEPDGLALLQARRIENIDDHYLLYVSSLARNGDIPSGVISRTELDMDSFKMLEINYTNIARDTTVFNFCSHANASQIEKVIVSLMRAKSEGVGQSFYDGGKVIAKLLSRALVDLRDASELELNWRSYKDHISLVSALELINNTKVLSDTREHLKLYMHSIPGVDNTLGPHEQSEVAHRQFEHYCSYLSDALDTLLP